MEEDGTSRASCNPFPGRGTNSKWDRLRFETEKPRLQILMLGEIT
jgi:hypothetical protein